jgi:hypothetical protein
LGVAGVAAGAALKQRLLRLSNGPNLIANHS